MTLKYSDEDEVTDEEMRELNLQAATHQYMMQQDAQNSTTPIPFQDRQAPSQLTEEEDKHIPDGQNTRLSQVAQKQLAYLPDGSPGFRMQILYLQQFFGTNWYLVCKDTFELFTIYDVVFVETTHHAQSQTFNLVTLDADLQEYLQDGTSCVNMKKERVAQLNRSYTTRLAGTPINKDFPHCMLSLQDCNKIHEDFIEATDILGKMYQAHEDLIMADPTNCIAHLKSHDEDLERVRKCFKRLETFMVSDNYFRSVSGLSLHLIQNNN